jgi:hypothetical protein
METKRLLELIANGTINSGMTREDAIALRYLRKQSSLPNSNVKPVEGRLPIPRLKPDLATLVDVSMEQGGADVVLGYIRGLERPRKVSVEEFNRAAHRVAQRMAKAKC